MKNKYWENFWVDYGKLAVGKDPQTQVLRTLNKNPIDNCLWNKTVQYVRDLLEVNASEHIVDLCCGNGLITKELAPLCKSVTAVDISSHLLDQIDAAGYKNIKKINKTILDLELPAQSYEKVILYAGIQYFDDQETLTIFHKVFRLMKPGGIFLIGDIPDQNKIWSFFNSVEREDAYFDSIQKGEPIVGNWYEAEFLEKLGRYTGFSCSEVVEQRPEMIFSFFRFDMVFMR